MIYLGGNPVAEVETSSTHTHIRPVDSSSVWKYMGKSTFSTKFAVSLREVSNEILSAVEAIGEVAGGR